MVMNRVTDTQAGIDEKRTATVRQQFEHHDVEGAFCTQPGGRHILCCFRSSTNPRTMRPMPGADAIVVAMTILSTDAPTFAIRIT